MQDIHGECLSFSRVRSKEFEKERKRTREKERERERERDKPGIKQAEGGRLVGSRHGLVKRSYSIFLYVCMFVRCFGVSKGKLFVHMLYGVSCGRVMFDENNFIGA